MKKSITIFAALIALALIGCEDSSEQLFTEIEAQNIEIFQGDNPNPSNRTWDAETE